MRRRSGFTGPEVTLHVAENDGAPVLGVWQGHDNRVWAHVDVEGAAAVVRAINEAIERANAEKMIERRRPGIRPPTARDCQISMPANARCRFMRTTN